jgi:CheY-like chemotaxis protein
MIADDNASVRRVLAEMLEARGASVDCASTEGEAVELIRRARVDCGYSAMLLDCRMGETDGYGLLNAMRRQRFNAGTVIPMLTTEDLNVKLPALRKVGLLQHLLKPIRRGELMQVLKAALNRDSVRPPLAFKSRKAASIPTQLRTHQQERRANLAPSDDAPSAAEQIGVSGKIEALRVLLADDSPDNRLLIDAFLKKCGWMLEYAENGEVAVQKFTSGNYDVVLMDIQMPVMDGYEASKQIREWEAAHGAKRTPIIALTASVLDEAVDKSFVAGCDTHVSKPIRRGALIAAIREVTSLRERSVPELSGVAISAGA